MAKKYIDGETFYNQVRKVYFGSYDWAVNKKKELMARNYLPEMRTL
jgi:hypothetical protein